MSNQSLFTAGSMIENRYRIVRELGRGGCGRTYLAADINRDDELCVLKEFAPQVRGTQALQKAKELFQREARMLSKLDHPQIPRFRDLLRVAIGGREFLFLVQEYIEGPTYWEILEQRQEEGKLLTTAEVKRLLLQLLPVLEYLHSQKAIHRDISPDNVIQRSCDKRPVLIDFGGVKIVPATALSKLIGQPSGTVLGKVGYSPDEQMREGKVYPSSDLYALGVTVLVLLTGKLPQDLYDPQKETWRWGRKVNSRSSLRPILEKMLADRPSDRFHCAREVREALGDPSLPPKRHILSLMSTVNLIGRFHNSTPKIFSPKKGILPSKKGQIVLHKNSPALELGKIIAISLSTFLVLLTGLVGLAVMNLATIDDQRWKLQRLKSSRSGESVVAEGDRAQQMYQRLAALDLDSSLFYQKVDRAFYAQNPEVKGRLLTNKPEDAPLRQQWYQIAEELLELEENRLFSSPLSKNHATR